VHRESIPELRESLEREQTTGKGGLNHTTQESIEDEGRTSQMDVTLGEGKINSGELQPKKKEEKKEGPVTGKPIT